MTQEQTLDQLVEQLAQARADLEKVVTDGASLELLIDALIEQHFGPAKAANDEAQAEASERVDELTKQVRDRAVLAFEQSGDKRPNSAIQIKEYIVLVYSEGDALEFARQHVPKALKLDRRAFERVAKVLEPDFVTVITEPRATIASDLSAWLPRGGETRTDD